MVRNCRIHGPATYPPDNQRVTTPSVQSWKVTAGTSLIIDCEITGGATVMASYAVGGTHNRIERCHIHGTVDGSQSNYGGNYYYGNYIHSLPWYEHDPHQNDGSHNDGIQGIGTSGQSTRSTEIIGNSFHAGEKGTSCVLFTQPSGTTVHELTISKNWFRSQVANRPDATAVALNLSQKETTIAFGGPVRVVGNRFQAWNGSEGNGFRVDHDGLIDQQTYDELTARESSEPGQWFADNTWLDGTTPAKITRITVT